MGSDSHWRKESRICSSFQSTLPVWGATILLYVLLEFFVISIHAPRVGSDDQLDDDAAHRFLFQSTLPDRVENVGVSAVN